MTHQQKSGVALAGPQPTRRPGPRAEMADSKKAVDAAKSKVRMESSRKMFDSVDSDKSGFIDPNEFQRLMRKLDATMSAQDVKIALGILDANGDGVIAFEEFAAWWCAGDPKENLLKMREAISGSAGAGDANEPFTFTLDS